MKPALILAAKEWRESFNSLIPYTAMVLFFLVTSWALLSPLLLGGQASLEGLFGSYPLVLGIFLPAFTMRLFSEEYKTGTIETLATLPLRDSEIVLGKYAAALAVWTAMLGLSLFYLAFIALLGDPDMGQAAAGFLGAFLLGAFYCALGLLASSLTQSQMVGFLLGFLFCFAFFVFGKTAEFMPGPLGVLLNFLGIDRHIEGFMKGVIDSRDILYFLSGTALALGGTLASFNSRRWR